MYVVYSGGARGVALDTLTNNMLLFHFLCLIALKEEFILAADSSMRVMRRAWCSA